MFIDSPKIESLANFERYISNLNSFEIKEFISAYSKHLSEEVSEKLLKELSKPQYEIRRNRQDFMVNIMGKFEEFPIVVEGRVSTIFNNPYFLVDIKQMGLFYKK